MERTFKTSEITAQYLDAIIELDSWTEKVLDTVSKQFWEESPQYSDMVNKTEIVKDTLLEFIKYNIVDCLQFKENTTNKEITI